MIEAVEKRITTADAPHNRRRGTPPHPLDPTSGPPLSHAVMRSFEDCADVQSEWDRLVLDSGGDVFASFDWCAVWWRYYGHGRQLEIHRFHQEGRLVAVVPLFREKVWFGPIPLRLVRLVGCDHSVTTAAPVIMGGYEQQVLGSLLDHICGNGPWDLLHFAPLPAYDSPAAAITSAFAASSVVRVRCRPVGPHMLFHLPDSYDAFLNELTAKERRNVRRDERRLEQNGPVECNCIHEGAEAHAALSRFIDLHQRHWRSEGQLGHFRDWPAAEPFHRELAERMSRRGRLIILEVRVGGDLVASEYGYRFGRRLHLLLTSRAPGIPGRLSFCSLVGHAIDRGVKLIDAMRGYYEHKKYLGAVTAEQESVSILPDRNLSRCRVQAGRGVSRVIHGAYYRIWFARLAPRIPALQRPLWQKWIRTRI